ncbi:uncharacterized protein LOC143917393 [Arctopsyche grandis]|uniref:uncharacterized protein LOC143917393 n=1 Tax=Arctopsyche grandis TaxID=121162 RepID=UPI00406D7A73
MNATEVASSPTTAFGYYSVRPRERPLPAPRKWNYYKLESESSQDESDGSESALSVQGKETDLAKDTSDTAWSSDESVVEYEVVSSNEERDDVPMQMIDGNGSSDTEEDFIATTVISITMLNEGDMASADTEDSLTAASTDSEISPFDYWICAQCRNTNNNPMFRYCEKCYKVRKDFFPPRPKRKRPKSKKCKKPRRRGNSSTGSSNDKMKAVLEEPESNTVQISGNSSSSPPKLDFQNIVVPSSIKGKTSVSQTVSTNPSTSAHSVDSVESVQSEKNEWKIIREKSESDSESRRRKYSETDVNDDVSAKRRKTDECDITVIKNVNKNFSFDVDPLLNLSQTTPINDSVSSFSQPLFPTFVDPPSKSFSDPALTFSKDDIDLLHAKSDHFSDIESDLPAGKGVGSLKRQNSNSSDSDKCITCLAEPKSGVFVHGRIAHICCCYKCSVKVWMKTKRCPICNCKVSNVLKAFVI